MAGSVSIASASVMGGGQPSSGNFAPPLDILSTSTTDTPALAFVPLAQPGVSLAISILGDSSSDPTPPPAPPAPVAPPVVLSIKDKASDLGIKDVMDKESWMEAKKIIKAPTPASLLSWP